METTTPCNRFAAYHVLPDSPQMQKDFLYIVASLMAKSSESNAADVVRVAGLNAILPVEVVGFQEYPGRGIGGLVTLPTEKHLRAILIGTRDLLKQCGLETPAILEVTARKWEVEPETAIQLVGWDGWVRGILKFGR
jgi:cation transport ATPase